MAVAPSTPLEMAMRFRLSTGDTRQRWLPGFSSKPVTVGVLVFGYALQAPAALAATVNGTPGPDTLHGTRTADVIHAGAGNDVVFAKAGSDRVHPGDGNDVMYLGPGADRVRLSAEAKFGRVGRDWVYGGPGPDVIDNVWYAELGRGNDRYLVRSYCQQVWLGEGDDVADNRRDWPGLGNCDLHGGPGDDVLRWQGTDAPREHHVNTLDGGSGADTLYGGYNEDHLIGGDGPDEIVIDEIQFTDRVRAGEGNDLIHLGNGGGTAPVLCGPGVDTVTGWDGIRELRDCELMAP